MALTLPAYGLASIDLGPELGMSSARGEGGLIVTSRHADAYLTGKLTTRELQPAPFTDMHAFLLDVVDRNERIDLINPRYRLPRSFTNVNWPMNADAELAGITDLRTLSVSGLVSGMVLKRGDRLALLQGDDDEQVICYRWIAADVTVSSITAQALSIAPRLPLGIFTTGAAVRLKDPFARLAIIPGSIETIITAEQLNAITFGVEEALR